MSDKIQELLDRLRRGRSRREHEVDQAWHCTLPGGCDQELVD